MNTYNIDLSHLTEESAKAVLELFQRLGWNCNVTYIVNVPRDDQWLFDSMHNWDLFERVSTY